MVPNPYPNPQALIPTLTTVCRWQLMDPNGLQLMPTSVIRARNGHPSKYQRGAGCLSKLRELCVHDPRTWQHMQLYNIDNGGRGVSALNFTDFTAEFLLTRGPFAMLGYGCMMKLLID